MRSIVRQNTGESYMEYVRKLAKEAGIARWRNRRHRICFGNITGGWCCGAEQITTSTAQGACKVRAAGMSEGVADKGYHSGPVVAQMQEWCVRT